MMICSIVFLISGFLISLNNRVLNFNSSAKTAYAAPAPTELQIPKDFLLSHTNNVGLTVVHDTIRDTIPLEVRHDTATIVKYKYRTKWRIKKVFNPDPAPSRALNDIDTLYVSKPSIVIPAVKAEAVDTTSLNVQ